MLEAIFAPPIGGYGVPAVFALTYHGYAPGENREMLTASDRDPIPGLVARPVPTL